MTGVPIRGEDGPCKDTDTQGEHHVMIEAEMGVMKDVLFTLQGKPRLKRHHQKPPGGKEVFHSESWECGSADTLISDF